jgi:hypothetical protein
MARTDRSQSTRRTVLVAGAANVVVAVAKLAAGLAERLSLAPHVFIDPTQVPQREVSR